MNEAHTLAQRRQKDQFFKSSAQSPLTPEQQAHFTGLNYYDFNPALHFTVTVAPFSEDTAITMQTTTGEVRQYRRFGRFSFTVDGQTAELTIYEADYGFFLPFVDAGAGSETYPAGRYLEPEDLGSNRFEIDFNQAYNPYCAYGPGWSCPLTPAENRLKVAIHAGEKTPQGAWVEQG